MASETTNAAGRRGTFARPRLSSAEVTAQMKRVGLDPADWDLPEITRKTNAWIGNCHIELTHGEVASWSPADQAAQYAEFGSLAAEDFIEQCVIEAGPESAPWRALAARVQAGDFACAPPVWQAERPAHLRNQ